MIATRRLTEDFHTAPQIAPEDVALLKAQGFTTLINHRPDGEAPDQPASAAIREQATREGLRYIDVPVSGAPTMAQARATADAAEGKTLAFCRTGTRSTAAWAMAQDDVDAALRTAADAGYPFPPAFEAAIRAAR